MVFRSQLDAVGELFLPATIVPFPADLRSVTKAYFFSLPGSVPMA